MKYQEYTALDFANDAFFIRWVKHPDAESDFFWETFLRETPSRRGDIDAARELILSLEYRSHRLSDADLTGMRNKLWMHILAEERSESIPAKHRRWWLAAAAVLLPLMMLAGYLLFYGTSVRSRMASEGETGADVVNHRGRNALILLDDGSRIWLKDSSTITYSNDFGNHPTRDVYLDGEAFFEVAKDTRRPFIVHASPIKIKVLGTAFSVKSYARDKTVETMLVSGSVHIEQSDDNGQRVSDVELKPNQRAVFNKQSKVIRVGEIAGEQPAPWKRNRLVFDEESIGNVLKQMEMWYGVSIHVYPQALHCKLTATIEKESLEEVLSLLQLSHNVGYTIDQGQVFITGSFCN